MLNFFHNLGIGILSTFLAFTGAFHKAPVVSPAEPSQISSSTSIVTTPTASVITSKTITTTDGKNSTEIAEQAKPQLKERTEISEQPTQIKPNQDIIPKSNEQTKVDTQKETDRLESSTILLDDHTPVANTVTTTNGQYSDLPVLKFDIHSLNKDQSLDSITINIKSSGSGNVTTASLYNNNVYPNGLVSSAIVNNGVATFSKMNSAYNSLGYSTHPYNVFSVKLNISDLYVGSSKSISTSVSSAKILNSKGQSVNVTGTVEGNIITVNGTSTPPVQQCPLGSHSGACNYGDCCVSDTRQGFPIKQ